ncbi:chemotaxis response regulator protein-glutamate methylesterase [Desulfuromonas versatilis]|uniref:Protein-glutamate methylesterase/protein-glutamine glutaminase n=1 Tax=Desulfuromonas versatilis TaxID=2802975 RepID=A0ABN6E316_9BACT|nr:chemotaxis response regulator protein-glutamate methylesterase [Desulfuromonas versatilis]BCR06647.1 chemotaxis response regulator protein-glutamate methylesterase [Desulfuromonas versatilis]
MERKIRVLIVDDSALVRQVLAQGLALDPALEVLPPAADPFEARDRIQAYQPDVMTLDVEMPKMDGLKFLRRLMPQHPLPVVMVSSLTEKGKQVTLDCLEAGAVDFVHKPTTGLNGLNSMLGELRAKVRIASTANVSHWKDRRDQLYAHFGRQPATSFPDAARRLIAIGASTGGTEAIKAVITRLPADMPGIVIVQHMPAGFTKMFADRLNQLCAMSVKEARTGDRVVPGQVLIAPGGLQMRVARVDGQLIVNCNPGPTVSGHCPSVDVLLQSVARAAGAEATGVVLTGMGADGADGLLEMRRTGARTLAQDEASSVVFGMPRVAYERGGAERLLPIDQIGPALVRLAGEKRQ